ncbi:MAG: hypothetical protein C3F18_04960 [Nitrosomonadales bacterium]|nr:MAG: hypothetical protein C3F18_04960 [Nitrosomonadales bacterium]
MKFDPWRHYLRGLLFEALKRPQPAIEAYREALRHDPEFAQAARCLAYLHAARNEHEQAAGYYLLALRLKPGDAESWFNLGFIRDQAHDKPGAIEAFCEAVRLKPTLDRAWYGMGMAHAALGQHQEAVTALARAAELQPMNGHAWYALGMACHHSHQPGKVSEIVHHLLRFDPAMTRRLIQDAERADLARLVQDLAL